MSSPQDTMNDPLIWKPSESIREIMNKDQVTPIEVREVLVECFIFAHGDPTIAMLTLKKQAKDVGLFWDGPDRDGLERLIVKLEDVAKSFRNPETIQQNRSKFQSLLRRCQSD